MKKWAHLGILVAVVAALLWWGSCRERSETKQDVQQKTAIAHADTVWRVDTLRLAGQRQRLAQAVKNLPDSFKAVPAVKEVLNAADSTVNTCTAVLRDCNTRVASRDKRIKTLERRANPFLSLYAEAGLSSKLQATPSVRALGEIGLELKIDHTTQIQVGATTDGDVKVGFRKHLSIF